MIVVYVVVIYNWLYILPHGTLFKYLHFNIFTARESWEVSVVFIFVFSLFVWFKCYFLFIVFAWDAHERGSDVHLQADPTKLELLHKTYKVKKEGFKEKQKDGILSKVIFLSIFYTTSCSCYCLYEVVCYCCKTNW